MGEENAKKRCLELCDEACESLNLFGKKSEMLKIANKFKPKFVCIVPEKRNEITTEGGLNLNRN